MIFLYSCHICVYLHIYELFLFINLNFTNTVIRYSIKISTFCIFLIWSDHLLAENTLTSTRLQRDNYRQHELMNKDIHFLHIKLYTLPRNCPISNRRVSWMSFFVTDFPIRDHKVILKIRCRRWTDTRTGKSFSPR